MAEPLVSVLIPTYKPQQDHLRTTLQCLLDQTEQNWHCVICDEPTDVDTESLIADFLEDERITYTRNEKCLGIGGNWNRCVTHVNAPYVAFLFQDDIWGNNHLEAGLKALQENESVGFVSIDHKYQYEGMDPVPDYEEIIRFKRAEIAEGVHSGQEFLDWWLQYELHPNVVGEPPYVMFKRETLEQVGPFNEVMPQFLDVEYWIRCLLKTNWYYIKEEIGAFRVHPDAASARNRESGAGVLDRFNCFQWLIANLEGGPLKKSAIAARNRAFNTMVQKYFARKKRGEAVDMKGAGGSGALKKFAVMHPVLTAKAIAKAKNM